MTRLLAALLVSLLATLHRVAVAALRGGTAGRRGGAYGPPRAGDRGGARARRTGAVRALYGRVRAAYGGAVSQSVRVRMPGARPGAGHPADGGSGGVRVPGGVPRAYPACTWAGQWFRRWIAPAWVIRRGVAHPAAEIPPRQVRREVRGTPQVQRKAGRKKPSHMQGENGRWLRRSLAARDGSRCFYCGTPFEDAGTEATFDHFLPVSVWKRGSNGRAVRRCHEPFNLVLACEPCNQAKGSRLPWPLVWLLQAHVAQAERETLDELPAAA